MVLDTDFTISVVDVDNAHRNVRDSLDRLWPEATTRPPSKTQMVAILSDLRLTLLKQATANIRRLESPFMKAAMRITGTEPVIHASSVDVVPEKTEMEIKFEATREARRKRLSNRY